MSEHPEPKLSEEQWAKIRELVKRTMGKLDLKGGTQADRPNPWHSPPRWPVHQYHDEPHWAIVDPRTGKLMDTAETDAFMHRISVRPECLAGTCRHYLGPRRPENPSD